MTNKLNSCSLWTHSHWAMLIILIFISTEICLILIAISCEFVSPRTVKKHSTNNKGKKRKFLPFTIGFWVQLRPLTAATRERKLHMVSWLSSRSGRRANLVPRVFSLSNMAAAGEKTLAHSELKRSLIGAFCCAFIRALSLVYSFQNKDGYPLRVS